MVDPSIANQTRDGISGTGTSLIFGQMGGLSSPSANVFGATTVNFGIVQTNDIKITSFNTERNYILNDALFIGAGSYAASIQLITRFE